MAWCPFAVHKPLSENHTQGSIKPRAIIMHTAVSSASSLFNFFQNNSNLESHFYVNDDGLIEQYMDTQIMADANKNANAFAVSIETEDGAQIKPWNDEQIEALVRLIAWLCDTHDIPKRQIPTATGSGIGWHVQFGAPGPWTPVAKSCPGAPRIEQTKNVIIPRVAAGHTEEDDMFDDADRNRLTLLEQNVRSILKELTGDPEGDPTVARDMKTLLPGNVPGWGTAVGNRTAIGMLVALVNGLLGNQPSRIPGDQNKTNVVDLAFDSAKWTFEDKQALAAMRDQLDQILAKLNGSAA